jgi:hypothetical protein
MGTLNQHLISGQVAQTLEEFSNALRATIALGSRRQASSEPASDTFAGRQN